MGIKAISTAALFSIMILTNAKAANPTSAETLKGDTVTASDRQYRELLVQGGSLKEWYQEK